MRLSILAISTLSLVVPAFAGETPWQEVAPGVNLRLVSTGQINADGTALIGLELDMPENTKTYWRVPGDTGLPTELDFAGSTGVLDHEILWPYPTRYEADGYLDYVYLGPTMLPIELKLAAGANNIEVSAVLGVCSDICVPAQAHFSLPVDGDEADMPNGLRIKQAAAEVPIEWDGKSQPFDTIEYRADDDMLAVHIADPDVDPASLIAATDTGEPLFGAPQKSPEPNLVLIPILGKSRDHGLETRSVQITFMTSMGPYEVSRSITVPKS
ncbi:protein-disulfide reductase DsbD domain-containing protein [Devosia epidermidihirudinis]|uniref:protein-disulfide reductase DsbD domain-containing protein n=1 Tax=Devosia epidermidihirudinis TaxID=1293439 RepID=UPI000695A809|nr:protein-disulfide reductase DsbD domain-containing protein [Devosia epidermidihirudinis]